MAAVAVWPLMTTSGIESVYAVAMPVTAFVSPGPEVTSATPTSPVARAKPSAACTAACSMAHQDMLNAVLFVKRVVDIEHRPAGITPQVLHALGLQGFDQDFSAHQFRGKIGREEAEEKKHRQPALPGMWRVPYV